MIRRLLNEKHFNNVIGDDIGLWVWLVGAFNRYTTIFPGDDFNCSRFFVCHRGIKGDSQIGKEMITQAIAIYLLSLVIALIIFGFREGKHR